MVNVTSSLSKPNGGNSVVNHWITYPEIQGLNPASSLNQDKKAENKVTFLKEPLHQYIIYFFPAIFSWFKAVAGFKP